MLGLRFEPKSEEELITLLHPGIGAYEVANAQSKTSKNGNPMIELTLKVWDEKGNMGQIYDYLMLNEHKFSLRKIRHFCYSSGIGELYENGSLNAEDCVAKSGKLRIAIQSDKSGKYPDKNTVDDYLIITNNNDKKEEPLNDDVPF